MSADERRARMARMRAVVKEHNIYHWAGNLIGELAEVRLEPAKSGQAGRRDSLSQNNVIRFKTVETGRTTREIGEDHLRRQCMPDALDHAAQWNLKCIT
jgi:hypothetical protein